MFGNSGDKLVAALDAYRRDFENRIRPGENNDVKSAAALIREAENIVRQSGLGAALAPTIINEIYHWPSWSQRPDFLEWVHFPAEQITASEKKEGRETIKGVLFTYQGHRYGVRFVDGGSFSLPDGDYAQHGKVDFVVDGETVLGLNISQDQEEYSRWTWFNLYAFKPGPWTKHLVEIAARIEQGKRRSLSKYHEQDLIERAKNIKL
jgi:hypothetical protein